MMTECKRRPLKARLGLNGYADLLGAFARGPATIVQIHVRTGIGKDTAFSLVPDMHGKGLLHVCGWNVVPRCPTTPIYAYGPGEDAAPPAVRANGRPIVTRLLVRDRAAAEIVSLASAMDALTTPASIYEIREETGIHRDTIKAFLLAMRKNNLARIASWQRRDCGGGQYSALWQLGSARNADYPNRKALKRQTLRNWRHRVKAAEPTRLLSAAMAAANGPMRIAA